MNHLTKHPFPILITFLALSLAGLALLPRIPLQLMPGVEFSFYN